MKIKNVIKTLLVTTALNIFITDVFSAAAISTSTETESIGGRVASPHSLIVDKLFADMATCDDFEFTKGDNSRARTAFNTQARDLVSLSLDLSSLDAALEGYARLTLLGSRAAINRIAHIVGKQLGLMEITHKLYLISYFMAAEAPNFIGPETSTPEAKHLRDYFREKDIAFEDETDQAEAIIEDAFLSTFSDNPRLIRKIMREIYKKSHDLSGMLLCSKLTIADSIEEQKLLVNMDGNPVVKGKHFEEAARIYYSIKGYMMDGVLKLGCLIEDGKIDFDEKGKKNSSSIA